LNEPLIDPFAFRTAANTNEPFPNDVPLTTSDPFSYGIAVVERLLNGISDGAMQH
jgi:hypothetical protein